MGKKLYHRVRLVYYSNDVEHNSSEIKGLVNVQYQPNTCQLLKKLPMYKRAAEIRKANSKGESKKPLSLVTNDMVQNLSISGTHKECRDKIKKLYDYGITLPVIRVSVKPFKEN